MSLDKAIDHYIDLVEGHSSFPPSLAAEAAALRDRLSTGQLHLAVLGQFKRGKSTLINALLGAKILPYGVLPVTLVPVFVHFGSRPALQISYDGNLHRTEDYPLDLLEQFANEANNPQNQKNVSRIDVYYPADLLRSGVVLIDTPGVGSTLQHNTETTLEFLPHCDAAIVVLSADPPITLMEVEFLRELRPHVTQLFFVLNKIDYLDADSAAEAKQFLSETLQASLGVEQPPVFSVSAWRGLMARLQNDEEGWAKSGMAALERALQTFAANNKRAALAKAVQNKAINLVSRADQLLALEQQAARLPLETLEQKIAAFQGYAQVARQQRHEISDRLAGDMARLRKELEQASADLQDKAFAEILRQAQEFDVPTHNREQTERFRQVVLDFLGRERQALHRRFMAEITGILADLANRAESVRAALQRDAADLLDVAHFPLLAEAISIEFTEPAWTIDHLPVKLTPTWGDVWWVPKTLRQQRQQRQRQELAREIAVRNVEKIRYWILRSIEEIAQRFQHKMALQLEETVQEIERALQAGRHLRESQAESLQVVTSDLTTYRERLHQIRQAIEGASLCEQNT